MKILVVTHRKHNKFRPKRLPRLGRLQAALTAIQANIKECSVYDLAIDDPRSYDLIFIMGAQQSLSKCYSEEWMYIEAKLIEKIIRYHIPCVGICFGAQHIAKILGSTVHKLPNIALGLTTVKVSNNSKVLENINYYTALKFHNDCFEQPPGSTVHALSADNMVDIFSYQQHILAFQSHPEMTPALFTSYWNKCITHQATTQLKSKILADLYQQQVLLDHTASQIMQNIFKEFVPTTVQT